MEEDGGARNKGKRDGEIARRDRNGTRQTAVAVGSGVFNQFESETSLKLGADEEI